MRIHVGNCLLALTSFGASLAGIVHAEADRDIFSLDIEELLHINVVTASRLSESAQHIPATVTVITRDQIQARGYRDLRDALRDTAGFVWHSEHNATVSDAPTWRGIYGGQKFLILQDGIRISSPAGDPETIAENFPLIAVERIEIVYGPASALYGADAFSGVINIISAAHAVKQFGLESADHHQRFSAFLPFNIGDVQLALRASDWRHDPNLDHDYPDRYVLHDLRRFNDTLFESSEDRRAIESLRTSRTLQLTADRTDQWHLGWRYVNQSVPTTIGSNPDSVNYDAEPHWHTRRDSIWFRYEHDSDNHHWEVQTTAQRFVVQNDSFFANRISNYLAAWKYASTTTYDIGAFDHYRWSPSQTFSYGISAGRISSIPLTADLQHPYDTQRGVHAQNQFYLGSDDQLALQIFDVTQRQYGAWLQHKSQWNDNWATTLGARWDRNSDYGAVLNPRAAINWQFNTQHSFRFELGQAYLAPSPTYVWRHYGSFNGDTDNDGVFDSNFIFVPNPDLKPEKLQTTELAWRFEHDKFVVETRLFDNEVKDFITDTAMSPAATNFIPGGEIHVSRHYDNAGKLHTYGGEISMIWPSRWRSYQLDSWLSVAHVDGQLSINGSDSELPYNATWSSKAGISVSSEHWQSTLNLIASGTTTGLSSNDHANNAPGYAVLNWYGAWRFKPSAWQMYLRIDNVGDRRYYNVTQAGGPYSFVKAPQDRRQIGLGLSIQW